MHARLARSQITDGNYFRYRSSYWPKSTDILWLDYPLRINLYRALRRTWTRWWRGETLFGTNCRESLWKTFVTRDSILWWVVSGHAGVRRRFEECLRGHEGLPLRARFTSPGELDVWVERLEREVAQKRAEARRRD